MQQNWSVKYVPRVQLWRYFGALFGVLKLIKSNTLYMFNELPLVPPSNNNIALLRA